MELSIEKYCIINPIRVNINGERTVGIDAQETLDKSLAQTYRNLGMDYLKFFKMDNLSKLATIAAEIIIKDTNLYLKEDNGNVALVLSNASSSLATDANYQQTITDSENYFPSPSLFVYTLPNICIGEICIKHKIFGENIFFVSQKFDASTLFFYVNQLFEYSNTEHCLTGWVECNENSYEAFMLLIERKTTNGITFDIKSIENLYKSK